MTTTTMARTFDLQAKLPRLPVPELPETLARFRESILPLAGKEFEAAAAVIEAFACTEGPRLQQRLLEYAKQQPVYIAIRVISMLEQLAGGLVASQGLS